MKPEIVTKLAHWKTAAAGCLALLVVACGSGGAPSGGVSSSAPSSSTPTSPATTPPNSVLCADVADLRVSLEELTHIKVGSGAIGEITTDVNNVRANVTALVNHARGQWQAQIDALKSALATFQTAVKNLAASPSTSAAADVSTALGDVNTAAQNLLAAVNTRCPSASPSAST